MIALALCRGSGVVLVAWARADVIYTLQYCFYMLICNTSLRFQYLLLL